MVATYREAIFAYEKFDSSLASVETGKMRSVSEAEGKIRLSVEGASPAEEYDVDAGAFADGTTKYTLYNTDGSDSGYTVTLEMVSPTLEELTRSILQNTDDLEDKAEIISSTTTNIKTDTGNIRSQMSTVIDLLTDIRGAIPDVRKDIKELHIVRAYIGDINAQREESERQLRKLFNDGYRVYSTIGQSKDWIRLLVVKYDGNNAPETL